MLRIDNRFLASQGLVRLPDTLADVTLKVVYAVLETRVGMRLAGRMRREQLDEFETFIDAGDEGGALAWLEDNFPDYRSVVAEEVNSLASGLAAASGAIRSIVSD
jgi:predicted RNA-binding Zn ribbon-like protein